MDADLATDAFIAQMRASGMYPPEQWRERALETLTWRHHAVIRLVVHGCADGALVGMVARWKWKVVDGVRTKVLLPPLEPGVHLPIEDACVMLGYRNGYARYLLKKPVFAAALDAARWHAAGRTIEHEEPAR